jgi:hypothetical protein
MGDFTIYVWLMYRNEKCMILNPVVDLSFLV